MKKLNIAIIGQGRSGRDIHGAFFKSDLNTKYNVIAIVDTLEERRIRAKEEWGCDIYSDYRELFGRDDIDLVVKDKKYLSKPPSYIINFGQGRERYLVYGNVITNRKIPAGMDNEISMIPYTPGLSYNKAVVDSIITRVQMRQFNFDMLYTLKKFYRNIRLLKDAK